ncbi:MAG: DUF3841 domain-containing protein [Clostridia bacterium]|nr:DUF3841 domain-containing protein [Clostridia bacterium]
MRLWTVQPVEVWKLLQENGRYVCDKTKSECLSDLTFVESYDWLVKEMEDRIGARDEDVEYPVWAWHTFDGKNDELDLDKESYVSAGEEAVCLEIEIPDNEVVLTDFNNWHCVLNNSYCASALSEEEWESEMKWFDSLERDEKKKVKEESWRRIFDITRIVNDFVENGMYVQATFWSLKLENVKKVRHFVGK